MAMQIDLLSFKLMAAQRSINRWLNRKIQATGLTAQQFYLLYILDNSGERGLTELGGELCLDRTTITRNLKAMPKLAKTVPSKGDRRLKVATITPEGSKHVRGAIELMRSIDKAMLEETVKVAKGQLLAALAHLMDYQHRK